MLRRVRVRLIRSSTALLMRVAVAAIAVSATGGGDFPIFG
jgi:hypothetical protein